MTMRIYGYGIRSYMDYGITSYTAIYSALGRSRVLIGIRGGMSVSKRYRAPGDSLHISRIISPIDIIVFYSHHSLIEYYSLTTSSLILL